MQSNWKTRILPGVVGLACAAGVLWGLRLARSTLIWTVDDTTTVFPAATFLRDYFWALEWGFSFVILLWMFQTRRVRVAAATWLAVNLALWLICVTFSVLEMAVRNVPVFVNGERVGTGL